MRTHLIGFQHTLSECLVVLQGEVPRGNFSHVNNMALLLCDEPLGGVSFDNMQGFPSRGAIEKNTPSVHLFHKSKNISFQLLAIVAI